jgi:biofilm PGA synthesis N-glycosyltransferase PgaC
MVEEHFESVSSGSAPDHGRGRYCLISPCRDEAAYVRRTLDSVVAQSVPPALWVIVDDGSKDDTPAILAEYARRFDYIRIIRKVDRGTRSVGPGVIESFYAGLESADTSPFEFLCKLDLDLELPPRYFELLISRMNAEPRLGTCSGKPYYLHEKTGRLVSERCGDEMSVGMTKFYRRECFDQIGGFVREVMWDGIDCHSCRMKGWMAGSWDDPDLRFIHLRRMGSSEKGILKGRLRHGFGQYFMGTGIVYVTASALSRMTISPWIVGGLAIWWGYMVSLFRGKPRYPNLEFRKFLQRYQWSCLLMGKARATRRLERKQESVWKPSGAPASSGVSTTLPYSPRTIREAP